jgi:hypothetical protein
MRMDRRVKTELGRMVKMMDYGLLGMRMDRRWKRELGRMGKRFLKNVGMKMGMKKSVIKQLKSLSTQP